MKELRSAAAVAVLLVAAAGSGSAWARAAPACAPSGTSLALVAETHKFDQDCLAVTAGESFTIAFDNRDRDRHNVAIVPSHTSSETLFAGDILPGPKSTMYAVPNMKAGTYHFHCEVHPNLMNGTFVVAAARTAAGQAAATPTTAAAPKPAAAAPAPAPVAPKPSPTTATTGRAAASTEVAATPPGTRLPRTGPANRPFLLLAGVALAAGGLSVLGGAHAKG